MHNTWKVLLIVFVALIIGVGVYAGTNPNFQARMDALVENIFSK